MAISSLGGTGGGATLAGSAETGGVQSGPNQTKGAKTVLTIGWPSWVSTLCQCYKTYLCRHFTLDECLIIAKFPWACTLKLFMVVIYVFS